MAVEVASGRWGSIELHSESHYQEAWSLRDLAYGCSSPTDRVLSGKTIVIQLGCPRRRRAKSMTPKRRKKKR